MQSALSHLSLFLDGLLKFYFFHQSLWIFHNFCLNNYFFSKFMFLSWKTKVLHWLTFAFWILFLYSVTFGLRIRKRKACHLYNINFCLPVWGHAVFRASSKPSSTYPGRILQAQIAKDFQITEMISPSIITYIPIAFLCIYE